MASAKTENLKRWRQKVSQTIPQVGKAEMLKANEKSADEFVATLQRIIDRGDPERGHLVDTIRKRAGDPEFGGLGVMVSIGDEQHPYPLHLEAGHKNADGSHTPPKPAWNPAKQIVAKKHKGRAARALTKAVKAATGGV